MTPKPSEPADSEDEVEAGTAGSPEATPPEALPPKPETLPPQIGAARAKTRKRRRRLGCLGFLLALAGGTFLGRGPILGHIATSALPGILAEQLGRPVTLEKVEFQRESDGWRIVVRALRVLESPGNDPPLLIAREIGVQLPSLFSLTKALDPEAGIQGVTIDGATYRHPQTTPSEAEPEGPLIPEIVLPSELPAVPFSVRATDLRVIWGEIEAHGSLELQPETLQLELPEVVGVTGLTGLALTAQVDSKGLRDIATQLEPEGTKVAGEVVASGAGDWKGRLGPVGFTLPTVSGNALEVRCSSFSLSEALTLLKRFLPADYPELEGRGNLTLQLQDGVARVSGTSQVAFGSIQVAGKIDGETIDLRLATEDLQLGQILQPYLSGNVAIDAITQTRATVVLPTREPTLQNLQVTGNLRTENGFLAVHGERLALHGLSLNADWKPGTPGAAPLKATLRCGLAQGSIEARGTGSWDDFQGSVAIKNFDLGAVLTAVLPETSEVRAICEGDLELTGSLKNPYVAGSLQSPDGWVTQAGETYPFRNLRARGYWQGPTLVVHEATCFPLEEDHPARVELHLQNGDIESFLAELKVNEGTLTATHVPYAEPPTFRVAADRFDVGVLTSVLLPALEELSLSASGTAEVTLGESLRAKIDVSAPTGHVDYEGQTLALQDFKLEGDWDGRRLTLNQASLATDDGSLSLDATVRPAASDPSEDDKSNNDPSLVDPEVVAHVVRANLRLGDGALEVQGSTSPSHLDLDVTFSSFDVGEIGRRLRPEFESFLVLDGGLRVVGLATDPIISGKVTAAKASFRYDNFPAQFEEIHLAGRYDSTGLHLNETHLRTLDGVLNARGTAAILPEQRWALALDYQDFNLARLHDQLTFLREIDGRLDGQVRITGALAEPRVLLAGSLRDGNAAIEGWDRLRDVSARFTFVDRRADLFDISATNGGGQLRGKGFVQLNESGGVERFETKLDLERVLLTRSSDLFVRGSGAIEVSGTVENPALTGQLEVTRGLYNRNYYPRISGGSSVPFDLFTVEDGFGSRLRLDVGLRLSGGFLIDNNRIEIAPHGSLRLLGTGRAPFLTGQISATDGKLQLPHLRLQIGFAELEFPVDNPYRPRLSLQGEGNIRDRTIRLVVTGSLEAPEISFSSDPELPEEEVLALVATGRFADELSSEKAEQVAAIELARLYAPEVFEWLFGRSSGDSLLDAVEVGVESARDQDESDRITVRVKVTDHLAILGERDKRGDVNLDLELFWWIP